MDINARIATRLRQLRDERGLTIESLAARSGVSRAMISKIERGETSPTAAVLNKLAIGLGVLLPTLFGPSDFAAPPLWKRHPIATRKSQPSWRDPATGYVRRTLTPATSTQRLQLSEIRFPAGASVTFENAFGGAPAQQQVWMLDGRLEISLGGETSLLDAGDCMAMTLDAPIRFHNPGRKAARYVVAITRGAG